jgi:urease accessory protein
MAIRTATITTITTGIIITMTEQPRQMALLRLMTWLSPAFPVGGFSYSHGLEQVVHAGLVTNRETLLDWLSQLIEIGSGWNDAVLFAESWRRARDGGDLAELAELAEALAGSQERHMETMLQGQAFVTAVKSWPHPLLETLPENSPYCVAVGAVAGAHGIPLEDALGAWLQTFASNLVQASIRLGVTGQSGGVEIIAALETLTTATAARAKNSTLDDLGTATLLSDVMAMRHETMHSRLFRS